MRLEGDPADRQQTLVAVAQADAAEVQRLSVGLAALDAAAEQRVALVARIEALVEGWAAKPWADTNEHNYVVGATRSCAAELRDALTATDTSVLDQRLAEAKAEALQEAADKWTHGAWSGVMLPKPTPPAVPVIAYSNRVGDWLRDRAAALTDTPDARMDESRSGTD